MGRIFFNGAQTICCLKLAIAFDAQESGPGISPFLNGASPRLAQCLRVAYLKFKFCFLCDCHEHAH
jgi:hypothetical protein